MRMVKGEPSVTVVRPRGNHPDGSRTLRRRMMVQLKASGRDLDDGEFGRQLVSA